MDMHRMNKKRLPAQFQVLQKVSSSLKNLDTSKLDFKSRKPGHSIAELEIISRGENALAHYKTCGL